MAKILQRLRKGFAPSRTYAVVIFAAGAVAMALNAGMLWADGWMHNTPRVWLSLLLLAIAVATNGLGATMYYLATAYRQYVKLRDDANRVSADVETFLAGVAEARAHGGEIVGVVIREPTGARHVVMDDDERVIH